MSSQPLLSLVICTRQREAPLRDALQSITECTPIDDDWEVLVVDNGPSAATEQVAADYAQTLPIRYIAHSRPGLSRARNRGIDEALGLWLLFLDDDVKVCKSYLAAYAQTAKSNAEHGVLGGGIQPVLTGNPPTWLKVGLHHVEDAYAARALVSEPEPIAAHTLPYGANFGLRRTCAHRHRFDEALGRHPDRPLAGGEELDVIRRVLEKWEGLWVPGGDVHHIIAPERQDDAYIGAYFEEAGRMAARHHADAALTSKLHLSAEAIARWSAHRLQYIYNRRHVDRPKRARNLHQIAWQRGFVKQLWSAFCA